MKTYAVPALALLLLSFVYVATRAGDLEIQQLKQRIAHHLEAGEEEKAEQLERQLHELLQRARRDAEFRPGVPDARGEFERREGAEQRLHHLHAAAEHLHAAGLHEPAEHIQAEAERIEHELHAHAHAEELRRELNELREHVGRLNAEVRELRELVERLTERGK